MSMFEFIININFTDNHQNINDKMLNEINNQAAETID